MPEKGMGKNLGILHLDRYLHFCSHSNGAKVLICTGFISSRTPPRAPVPCSFLLFWNKIYAWGAAKMTKETCYRRLSPLPIFHFSEAQGQTNCSCTVKIFLSNNMHLLYYDHRGMKGPQAKNEMTVEAGCLENAKMLEFRSFASAPPAIFLV